MKTSRRNAIKTIAMTSASIAILPLIGCEKAINSIVEPKFDSNSISKAAEIVNQFCLQSTTENIGHNFKKLLNEHYEIGDSIMVINGHRIISAKSRDEEIIVFVEYNYIGNYCAAKFFKIPENKQTIVAKYIVKNGIILNGQKKILSKELFRNKISRDYIENYNLINIYSNKVFMKNYFTSLTIVYHDILSSLS